MDENNYISDEFNINIPDLSTLTIVDLKKFTYDIVSKYKDACTEKYKLYNDIKRRQDIYINKEEGYKKQISELVNKNNINIDSFYTDKKINEIRNLYSQVNETVNIYNNTITSSEFEEKQFLDRAKGLEEEKEKEFLYQKKISELNIEVRKLKNKLELGNNEYIERNNKLSEEIISYKKTAEDLNIENVTLIKDLDKLKSDMKAHEEDRNHLVKQLVLIKKENARLRLSLSSQTPISPDSTISESINAMNNLSINSTSTQPLPTFNGGHISAGTSLTLMSVQDQTIPLPSSLIFSKPKSSSGSRPTTSAEPLSPVNKSRPPSVADNSHMEEINEEQERYMEVIKRLKRALDLEQKKYRQMKTQFANHLTEKTELEVFLRKAIEDVSHNVANRNGMKNSRSMTKTLAMSNTHSKQKLNFVEVQLNGSRSSASLRSQGSTSNLNALRNVDSRSSLLSSPKAEQTESLEIGNELLKKSAELRDFTHEDKELVVSALLSNPAVLQLLADAAFNRNLPISQ